MLPSDTFPILRTERLLLRRIVTDDAPALFVMRSDERVMRHIPRPMTTSIAEAAEIIASLEEVRAKNEGITWGIALADRCELIGTIGFYRWKKEHFRAEVGYLLHPDHWGKGLAGEALDAVVEHGFKVLGLHSIEAVTDPGNTASNALLARHGFVQEAHFREDHFWNGRFLDSLVWSRLTDRPALTGI
jgi:ribosomal-protein-alanine N-acetyltransferase